MSRAHKVSRNDPCPCGSVDKFKRCCEGKVDWENVFRTGADWRPLLSIRGRNIHFLNKIADVLQLDNPNKIGNLKNFKAAFTADAVRRIHEAIFDVWPQDLDIHAVLRGTSTAVSGLYVGDYTPEYLIRGIIRHSIYTNKILVVDPFIYPASVRDKYNPILQPEQHRTQTLRNVNFWLSLGPWIEAGIVEIIRTPADFDRKLNWDSLIRQKQKFESNDELQRAAEISVEEFKQRHMEKLAERDLLLSAPDSYLRKVFDELQLSANGLTVEDFIDDIHSRRELDPNFLGPFGPLLSGQLTSMTTGTSYDIAKLTAGLTRSYLITDAFSKWREIELDREAHSAENKAWAPFAKALQGVTLPYIDNIRLDHAMRIREEGRLGALRSFLRRVWKDACSEDSFDITNAQLLADELLSEIKKAEEEWKQIDRDLIKIVGTVSAGVLSASPLIAPGQASFLAAATILTGITTLASSVAQHRGFPDKFPAAFFMKLDS